MKRRKIDLSNLNSPKIPVEVCLEDLMVDLAKKGVKKFSSEERLKQDEEGRKFILKWRDNDGFKCVCLSVRTEAEIKSLRKTFRLYCREMNRRIKAGGFDGKTAR